MRMALILKLLAEAGQGLQMPEQTDVLVGKLRCENPRCITSCEQELEHVFKQAEGEEGVYRCIYCEAKKHLN